LIEPELLDRIQKHAREWRVAVEDSFETATSAIAFGKHHQKPVVLKVVKRPGDEWRSGEILEAFDGGGIVRVYEHAPGAVLMERLRPGNSLASLALNGRDEEATEILGAVIQQMSAIERSSSDESSFTTVHDWAGGFERYIASGDKKIPRHLVEAGQRIYLHLCASLRQPRLLHGDLQHYNVLFDSDRGWVAIDPKGVVGDLEYELGAILRNPFEQPDLFLSVMTIEKRLKQLTSRLSLDLERARAWVFAQAVLSAIWDIEDGFVVNEGTSSVRLAQTVRPAVDRIRY